MSDTILSPNMNLPIPVVGNDPTPTWGTDLNSCLTLIDAHNHQPGYGEPITPGGLNINADLPMNNNNLTNAATLGMQVQLSDPSTLGVLYYKGLDLYFNDGSSNHIRMTSGGSVTGSTGTITGLPSGTASASYNAGTFVFQSATNTAANLDGESIILRNAAASSKGLTLSPPAAMGADFALTLPNVPAQTNVMTLTSGGSMGSITYDAVGQAMTATGANAIGVSMTATGANAVAATRTRAITTNGPDPGLGGVCKTSSSGAFSNNSNAFVTVTNLTGTLTTSGRPVQISFQDDGTGNFGYIGGSNTSGTNVSPALQYRIYRGVTIIASGEVSSTTLATGLMNIIFKIPFGALNFIDTNAPAGANTYHLEVVNAAADANCFMKVQYCVMGLLEL